MKPFTLASMEHASVHGTMVTIKRGLSPVWVAVVVGGVVVVVVAVLRLRAWNTAVATGVDMVVVIGVVVR